jgi:hypothetical protein
MQFLLNLLLNLSFVVACGVGSYCFTMASLQWMDRNMNLYRISWASTITGTAGHGEYLKRDTAIAAQRYASAHCPLQIEHKLEPRWQPYFRAIGL